MFCSSRQACSAVGLRAAAALILTRSLSKALSEKHPSVCLADPPEPFVPCSVQGRDCGTEGQLRCTGLSFCQELAVGLW